ISLFYEPIKNYLEKIPTDKFPHHIFTYDKKANSNEIASCPIADVANKGNFDSMINKRVNSNEINKNILNDGTGHCINENRASQIKFPHIKIEIKSKNDLACKLACLALNLASTNNQRHQAIQNFFLINDSTTIAVEVPIYLTNWDAGYYRNQKGFIFPLINYTTPITGHIDLLQIRNGLIHILDYKPDAKSQKPIEQLTIYALALSRKLNLPLYYFKAAWFDENNYFEFFPLHAVYEKRKV
ncbi:PD-(D/E)XK nuclease family protein, partial [Candidatus Woesearchaeota archaeon]|nr:PD-(D/E)XK nuclease family protein [Candidatus Woesearchaeota archaeon]